MRALGVLVLFAACGGARASGVTIPPANAQARDADPVVAVVDGETIRASNVAERVKELPDPLQALDSLIREHLVKREATRLGVRVRPAEVDDYLKRTAAQSAPARAKGIDVRATAERSVREMAVFLATHRPLSSATDAEIHAAYLLVIPDPTKQPVVEVRALVLRAPNPNAPELKSRVDRLSAQLRSDKDFCAIVKRDSDDVVTRDNCGAYGVTRTFQLRPELRDAIGGHVAGDIVGPLAVDGAVVFMQVINPPHLPTWAEVGELGLEPQMNDRILDIRRQQWLDELRQRAKVTEPGL